MAKRPENRFQTMAEVVRCVEGAAVRQKIPFDFDEILAKRSAYAEKQLAAESKQLRDDSRSSSVAEFDLASSLSKIRKSDTNLPGE